MAVVLAVIELNERDGQLLVDKYLYNNSYPDYSEDSYYRLWRETVPFEEWAEDAPSFEWEELVNNTEFDITELKEEKIKEAKIKESEIEENSIVHRTPRKWTNCGTISAAVWMPQIQKARICQDAVL